MFFWLWEGSVATGYGPNIDWSEGDDRMAITRVSTTFARVLQFRNSSGVASALNAGFVITVIKNGVVDAATASLTVHGTVTGGYTLSFAIPGTYSSLDMVQFYITGVLTTGGDTVNLLTPVLEILPVPTSLENCDIMLNRDMSGVTLTNARTPGNAFRILRNRVVRSTAAGAGTMDVYREDDVTIAWSSVTAVNATAGPIVSSDPA